MALNPNTRDWIVWILTGLIAALVAFTGIMKLTANPEIVKNFSEMKAEWAITLLGIVELVAVALYVYPKTLRIGFFLLCSYFGGAMAAHLSQPEKMVAPTVILTIIWAITFLRDRKLFLPNQA